MKYLKKKTKDIVQMMMIVMNLQNMMTTQVNYFSNKQRLQQVDCYEGFITCHIFLSNVK